jgi:nucleoside-diphosphate-sugar epimerase
MRALVTGANGFVGRAAVQSLAKKGHSVVAQTRKMPAVPWPAELSITSCITDFDQPHSLHAALQGCDWVMHTAARVHQVHDTAPNPLDVYRKVNALYTLALANAAAAHGVKRFVFLSSIKVNGDWTSKDHPFQADDASTPVDPYGISKHEAELGLREIAAQTGMQVVIVRPPLVYGPGVKANFLTMMRWLQRGIPLPLGAIHNQRSLVGLGNLVDLLEKCLIHPAAANQTFLASDGQDVSTTELLRALAQALQVKPRLIAVPQAVLEGGLKLLGRGDLAQRLCGNLTVDIAKTRDLLSWTPPFSLEHGLRSTAEHFLAQRAV